MKASLLLFCTLFVIENFVIANNEFTKSPLLKDLYNKRKKHKEVLLNGPKLVNKRILKLKYGEPRNKKHHDGDAYTVFPNPSNVKKQAMNVPSSPYFSGDPHHDEPKLRVKKVLPDFWNSRDRKKREAVAAPEAVTEKKKEKKETVEKAAVATSEGSVQPSVTKDAEHVKAKTDVKAPASSDKGSKPVTKQHSTNKTNAKPVARSNKKSKKPAKINVPTSRKSGKSKLKRSGNKKNRKSSHISKRSASKKGKESESRRLIAARDALIENYPYVVSIQKDGEHWCAGALLNQRLVITTANCVWKSSRMSRMKIRAGSRHLEHGGQLVNIAEVLKHPRWSIRNSPDYDVALLLTDGFVKFSHSCHAVDLPNRVMMPVFDDAWVASWGAERRDGVYVKQGLTLQVYHSNLINREKCNNVTMRYGVLVTDNFICLEQAGRRAPCTRDTGAPAVSDGVLWGLASWGIRKMCGTERFPAMFSYIASQNNMDFIINGTKWLMSEERLSPFLDRYPFPRIHNETSRS